MFTSRILKVKRSLLVTPLLVGMPGTSVLVAQTPSSAINHYNVGVKENRKKNFDRAIEEFTIAIEISSHPVPYRSGGRTHSLHLAGKAELDATDEAKPITVLDKFTGLAYGNRCFARVHKGDFVGAIADCDQAVRISPRLVEAYLDRGIARQMVGDATGAFLDLNKAIEIDAHMVQAFVVRG